jgi:hypothetical protein
MASKDEIMEKIYSVLSDNSCQIHDVESLSIPHKLSKLESKNLRIDLDLKGDDMMIIFSEFSDAFGIGFGDFLDAPLLTVGDLVDFVLSRVDAS